MLTLHGNESPHDEIVEKSGAYKAISEFKDIMISNGFAPMYNIMINKYVAGDLSFLAQDFLADSFAYRLTIPLYVPTDRMRAFQKLRANLSDCIRVAESLKQSGLDDAGFRSKAVSGSEQNIRENIKNWDINIADKNQPQWAFFNIAQDLSLFYGNVGLHTKYLGNIRDMSAEQIVCAITAQLPNFDYSAYYDIAALPSISQIADRADISNNYVYSDVASCIYSWLDSNGTLNILQ